MLTFDNGLVDRRACEVKAQVAKYKVAADRYEYICIGTAYGHIHRADGSVRTWKSYSGARRFLNKYLEYYSDYLIAP